METLIIKSNSKEDTKLYEQLAKRLNNTFTKVKEDESRKKEILDGIADAIQQVKEYESGKIKLQTAEEFFNDL
ncbi:MAG: hypothetical protein QM610_04280 [Chitinophagaceae bacterium]